MNDALAKFIFANEQHKDSTLALINSVFEFEGTKEIVADIATVENQDDFKRLIDLFNLNQSKKNALRMVKLKTLLYV